MKFKNCAQTVINSATAIIEQQIAYVNYLFLTSKNIILIYILENVNGIIL